MLPGLSLFQAPCWVFPSEISRSRFESQAVVVRVVGAAARLCTILSSPPLRRPPVVPIPLRVQGLRSLPGAGGGQCARNGPGRATGRLLGLFSSSGRLPGPCDNRPDPAPSRPIGRPRTVRCPKPWAHSSSRRQEERTVLLESRRNPKQSCNILRLGDVDRVEGRRGSSCPSWTGYSSAQLKTGK